MAARKSSRVHPKYKTKYRPENWSKYEAGLRARGDIQIWICEDAIENWTAAPTGRPGAPRRYSDTAVLTSLTLGIVFKLPLRQTEGFVASILRLMELDLMVPDHSTLSRRRRTVEFPKLGAKGSGPIHLIVDSTGLKIFGAGEWNQRKFKKRRTWRKLHIGVDREGQIVAALLSDAEADDAITAAEMIEEIDEPIQFFTADGAYDRASIYEALDEAGTDDVKVTIPPRKDATRSSESDQRPKTWSQRDAALDLIDEEGRRAWQRESGYHQQGKAENAFFRRKTILGGSLRSRLPESQEREALLGCHALNLMLELGRPSSVAIEA